MTHAGALFCLAWGFGYLVGACDMAMAWRWAFAAATMAVGWWLG